MEKNTQSAQSICSQPRACRIADGENVKWLMLGKTQQKRQKNLDNDWNNFVMDWAFLRLEIGCQ